MTEFLDSNAQELANADFIFLEPEELVTRYGIPLEHVYVSITIPKF
jgi:hypothetical protein